MIKYNNTDIYYLTKYKVKDINNGKDNILNVLCNICKIIYIIRKLFDNKKKLTIYYFDTKFEKKIPNEKNKILNEFNCNSGASFVGEYIMFVWRREEYMRVLIHEMIHSFLGDFFLINNIYNIKLGEYFCIENNGNINMNETYTETIATIINMIYRSLIDNNNDINEYFMNELEHSIRVLVGIMRYYRYKSIDELMRVDGCKEMKQKTSVFNYYVMKPFMMVNVDDILNNRNEINGCIKNLIFKKRCVNKFYDIIINNFNNNELKKVINYYINDKKYKTTKSLSMVYYK